MEVTPAKLALLDDLARAASTRAYAPFSHFHVGAAVLLESGETVAGCNVENSSFRLTVCAEQNAIAAAVASYGPALRLRAVVVTNRERVACSPCGACRQMIAEFAPPDASITFPGVGGIPVTTSIASLLPHAFGFVKG